MQKSLSRLSPRGQIVELCNGYALARGLDIAHEAGPARALIKVYRGLHPNAQGKLIVSFVPEVS